MVHVSYLQWIETYVYSMLFCWCSLSHMIFVIGTVLDTLLYL